MANGHDGTAYNSGWCNERHDRIDKRLAGLEGRLWAIIVLLVGNIGGVVMILVRGV